VLLRTCMAIWQRLCWERICVLVRLLSTGAEDIQLHGCRSTKLPHAHLRGDGGSNCPCCNVVCCTLACAMCRVFCNALALVVLRLTYCSESCQHDHTQHMRVAAAGAWCKQGHCAASCSKDWDSARALC
jgi:hypothetical protein